MTEQHAANSNPPRWAENLLRLVLRERDRDAISGDLLEEYQDAVLPANGRVRANLWYLNQTLSFVKSVTFGVFIGAVFSLWMLIQTLLDPFVEDTVELLIGFFGPMFVLWGFAAFIACRRTGRFVEALKSGLIVSGITTLLFHIAGMLRVNLSLDAVLQRPDWQHLLGHLENSEFQSVRAHANYMFAKQVIPRLLLGTSIGVITACIGGLACKLSCSPRYSGLGK